MTLPWLAFFDRLGRLAGGQGFKYLQEVFDMATNGFLTREAILNAPDLMTREVEVPEWGGKVLVKGLSSRERAQYEEAIMVTRGKGRKRERDVNLLTAREELVVRCVVNHDGSLLFQPGDVAVLGRKSGAALSRVADVAMELAGLTDADMEELEGNSETPRRDDSATG